MIVTVFAPLIPGVDDVRKGVVRRQHWMTVWLLEVTRAEAVRYVVLAVGEDWARRGSRREEK